MKIKFVVVVGCVALFTVLMMQTALAWPESPPFKAFISGPGIETVTQITDANVLQVLRLGGIEDMEAGAIAAPNVEAEGYKILRYFENGSFRFADLVYYPNAVNGKGVVYFQDGPQLIGNHTQFNGKWLNTTAQGDAILNNYIKTLRGAASQDGLWLVPASSQDNATLAFDTLNARLRTVLPRGIPSADGKMFFAAFASYGMTAVHGFDVTNGLLTGDRTLRGDWELRHVSANGEWLALQRVSSANERAGYDTGNVWVIKIAVVKADGSSPPIEITLNGNFEVDAVNAIGVKLYVIEHLPAVNPDRYQVRVVDLRTGVLQDWVLADKRDPEEIMEGAPLTRAASPNGEWLLTLYVRGRENEAFIHALNLREGYAFCIDLPSGSGDREALKHYTLTLTADGLHAYAVNPALGIMANVNMLEFAVSRTVQFTAPSVSAQSALGAPPSHSVLTRDNRTVYFTDGSVVWQYDISQDKLREVAHSTVPILDLAASADNLKVYLALADHTVTVLNPNASASQ